MADGAAHVDECCRGSAGEVGDVADCVAGVERRWKEPLGKRS